MSPRLLATFGIFIIVIAVIAAAGYVTNSRITQTADLPIATSTTSLATSTASSATTTLGSTIASSTLILDIPPPASTTVDTANWIIHVDHARGYSIEYPANLIENGSGGAFGLAFPKNAYFHWPLLDDAKVTVTIAPGCPGAAEGYEKYPPVEFSLGGRVWKRNIATDVAAGNRYIEVSYSTLANGSCYHVSYLSRGANGAGLYVDNTSLVMKYDAEHKADFASVMDILYGMVGSLRILAIP